MIAVIFEVWPDEARRLEYFDIAARLKEDLAGIDGFLSVERFESLRVRLETHAERANRRVMSMTEAA